jgi:2,4-dienoyl-CoA reductase-like NADH-dependent reductase (Old Yellow Enzyme family)
MIRRECFFMASRYRFWVCGPTDRPFRFYDDSPGISRGAPARPLEAPVEAACGDTVSLANIPTTEMSPAMTASALFTPLALGPVQVPNRIVISPMCQYSADDGSASDWHLQHVMTLAMSGAGLVTLEATAVERRGRITHGCLGLYSDANERALARLLAAARGVALPGTRFGIQIAHAGRKGSAQRPWEGGNALPPEADPWITVAPSALPHADGWHVPHALPQQELDRVRSAFVDAATRAVRIGFDVIEMHLAHGYLLHEFHSPVSNQRQDAWGGSPEKRRAFPLAVTRAVRAAVPAHVAVGARITGCDWIDGGLTAGDAVALASELKALNCAYVCVTSGGLDGAHVPVGPHYQVPLAERVRRETGIVTRAVGMIVDPVEADRIIRNGAADQIAIARAALDDPRWGWHAAEALGFDLPFPPQYLRARPSKWPGTAQRHR